MLKILSITETPPGGWRHKEKHSGMEFPEQGVMLRDFGQFLRMVREHRRATGGDLDIGWEERLQHELCQEHPEYRCMEEGKPADRTLTLGDVKQFLHTASNFIDQGGQFVTQQEADRRALICTRCPLNQHVSGCFGCAGIADAAMNFIAQRKTANHDDLQSCGICGCFLRVKVWMPVESMVDNPEEYPAWCWRHGKP